MQKTYFVTMRHKKIRNITAELLREIYSDVKVELQLQQFSRKQFEAQTTKKEITLVYICMQEVSGGLLKKH